MKFIYLILFLIAVIPGRALSGEALEYARITYSPIQSVAERLLSLVYDRAGIEMEITPLPAKRASYESSKGFVDGEIMRIESYGADKSDLYRIPYPLGYVTTQLYVLKDHNYIAPGNLENYRVAVVKGVRHSNEYVRTFPYVYQFSDVGSLFRQLSRGRVDAAVVSQINARYELNKNRISTIRALGEPLKKQGCFHYINKKHRDVIARIEQVMKGMTDSGELLLLWEQYSEEMIGSTAHQSAVH